MFFDAAGNPFTPGNFSSTGGIVRQKPDITAADGTKVTGAGSFPTPFFGTSAAAPHAAAIAALLKSANPGLTQAQIRTALVSSAIDIEIPGTDRDTGAGIVMAPAALQAAGLTPRLVIGTVTASESGGNANGIVEPGEQGTLSIALSNPEGGAAATAISATLTANTPGVTVLAPGSSSYPDIAPTASGTNTTPFAFVVPSSLGCPSKIDFKLTVNFAGTGSPRVLDFAFTVARGATINETLDATPPAAGGSFTAATGLQTGRLVRLAAGAGSYCGAFTASPGINAADANIPHEDDAYTFQNTSASSICVTVSLTTSLANAGLLQSAAYALTFVPAQPDQNHVGDIAGNGPAFRSYSFDVPASTAFVVVVNEVTGPTGPVPYTLNVAGVPCAAAPLNLAPVNTIPAAQATAENRPLVFSAAAGNQIAVADADAGNAPLRITLASSPGTLTLNGTTGLSFSSGDGTADAAMTFTGSATNINAALNGMTFTPPPGYSGPAGVQISSETEADHRPRHRPFASAGGPGRCTDRSRPGAP